jgi:hypothetical protein
VLAMGVFIAALGQTLQANLDVAVNTSPFMDNSLRARTMYLDRGMKSVSTAVLGI